MKKITEWLEKAYNLVMLDGFDREGSDRQSDKLLLALEMYAEAIAELFSGCGFYKLDLGYRLITNLVYSRCDWLNLKR